MIWIGIEVLVQFDQNRGNMFWIFIVTGDHKCQLLSSHIVMLIFAKNYGGVEIWVIIDQKVV